MHAMLITFHTAVGLDELEEPFTVYAEALREVPGLISKSWIRDSDTIGGFHLFRTSADAERYLSSQMVADLTSNPVFSGFEVRHFGVLERLSRVTGVATVPLSV